VSEITIRFVQGTAWDSRLIEWRTNAWCSHVEAVLDGGRTLGAMLDGGVRIRYFTDACYRDVKRWEIWRVPCLESVGRDYYEFLGSQVGRPYDWRSIASLGISRRLFSHRNWRDPDSWICSELQAAAAEHSGLFRVPAEWPTNLIVPGDDYAMFGTQLGASRD
jgi:hypothetical protein